MSTSVGTAERAPSLEAVGFGPSFPAGERASFGSLCELVSSVAPSLWGGPVSSWRVARHREPVRLRRLLTVLFIWTMLAAGPFRGFGGTPYTKQLSQLRTETALPRFIRARACCDERISRGPLASAATSGRESRPRPTNSGISCTERKAAQPLRCQTADGSAGQPAEPWVYPTDRVRGIEVLRCSNLTVGASGGRPRWRRLANLVATSGKREEADGGSEVRQMWMVKHRRLA